MPVLAKATNSLHQATEGSVLVLFAIHLLGPRAIKRVQKDFSLSWSVDGPLTPVYLTNRKDPP